MPQCRPLFHGRCKPSPPLPGRHREVDFTTLSATTGNQTPRLYRGPLQICIPKQAFVQHTQTAEVHHSPFTPECDEMSRPQESTQVQAPTLPARSVVARKPMPPFSATVWARIVPELTTCPIRSPLGSTCTTAPCKVFKHLVTATTHPKQPYTRNKKCHHSPFSSARPDSVERNSYAVDTSHTHTNATTLSQTTSHVIG